MGMRTTSVGHIAFAATMIALGVVVALKGFTPVWTGVPRGVPAREAVAWLCALVSVACGVGLLLQRAAAIASRVLLGYLVLWFLLFRLPLVVRIPAPPGAWWGCGEIAVMIAAAWVLYARFASDRDRQHLGFATGDQGVRIARVLFGLGLIPIGIAHFTFLERTVSMVPAVLPWHLGWAYATGAAFIAAGLAVLIGVWARLAAALVTLEMGLFTLIVWVPTLVAGPRVDQWNEFVGSWVLTVAAWVVADSWRGTPWFGGGRRQ
jgi:uncharacterized membrane protein